jgi:tetratricopeptide (TPR) repeat protein
VIDPQCAPAKSGEALVLEQLGDFEAAAKAYRAAIDLAAESEDAYLGLDRVLSGMTPTARVTYWEEIADRHSGSPYAEFRLGKAREEAGDRERAERIQAAIAALDPERDPAARRAQFRLYEWQAQRALDRGAAAEAEAACRNALARDPSNVEIRAQLARALEALGEPDQAEAVYREAIALQPNTPRMCEELDRLLQDRRDPANRVAVWRDLAARCPDAARPQFHLGMALEQAGDLQAAIDAYRRCVALRPGDPAMQAALGLALGQAGDWQAAVAPLREALRINPDMVDARIWVCMVRALVETHDYARASKTARRCRELGMELPQDLLTRLARESGQPVE